MLCFVVNNDDTWTALPAPSCVKSTNVITWTWTFLQNS